MTYHLFSQVPLGRVQLQHIQGKGHLGGQECQKSALQEHPKAGKGKEGQRHGDSETAEIQKEALQPENRWSSNFGRLRWTGTGKNGWNTCKLWIIQVPATPADWKMARQLGLNKSELFLLNKTFIADLISEGLFAVFSFWCWFWCCILALISEGLFAVFSFCYFRWVQEDGKRTEMAWLGVVVAQI